jgi:hypothetical protein
MPNHCDIEKLMLKTSAMLSALPPTADISENRRHVR